MSETTEIPLFPLRTVLTPGGLLPLRIFETRYLDMVRGCMRDGRGFGVVLIQAGAEARMNADAQQPDIAGVGTLAKIIDFNALNDGMLGLMCEGTHRFRIEATREQSDHLLLGSVVDLSEPEDEPLAEEFTPLAEVLSQLAKHPAVEQMELQLDTRSAASVGWRLLDLLPLEPALKQQLLQMDSHRQRLVRLGEIINQMRFSANQPGTV